MPLTHTVAQFYLKSFAVEPGSGNICRYDKGTDYWRRVSISKHAEARPNFYHRVLEEQVQRLEDRAARPIRRLVSGPLPMRWDDQERRDVSEFIAVQVMRTPKFFREVVHPRTKEGLDRTYGRGVMTDEYYSAACQQVSKLMEAGNEAKVQSSLVGDVLNELLEEDTQNIYRADWMVVHAPVGLEDFRFLTSDNPVLRFRGERTKIAVAMPVSPGRLLMVGVGGKQRRYTLESMTWPLAQAKEVNSRMLKWSDRYLYASGRQEWVSKVRRR